MSLSYDSSACAEVEGLLCLSDLPELTQQSLCSPQDPCLHFFQGMGFRPAAWTTERDQYGDHKILIVSGDDAYLAKYDLPFEAMTFWPMEGALPLPAAPARTLLATPGGAPAGTGFNGSSGGFFGGGGGSGGGTGSGSVQPGPVQPGPIGPDGGTPTDGGQTGGGNGGGTEIPPLAAVPLSGSGLFLVLALVAMMVTLGRRRLARTFSAGS